MKKGLEIIKKGNKRGLDRGLRQGMNKGLHHIPSVFEPETILWLVQLGKIANVTLPSAYYQANMNLLIKELKKNNFWRRLDRMWVFAAEQQAHAVVSIVNPNSSADWPSNITEVNTPSWTKLQGYIGNGSAYLNTNYNPTASNYNVLQNNTSFGVYIYNLVTGTYQDMGAQNGGVNGSQIIVANTSGGFKGGTNCSTFITASPNVLSPGLFAANRADSNIENIFRNGLNVGSLSNTSAAQPNYPFFIMAVNDAGTVSGQSSNTYSMAFIGSAEFDQGVFYNIFQQFACRLGFNV
ncbi:MAG TPA: hypothetical protein VNY36_04175 [Bacteroidia bacterium]|jgi:hypothetical protein|nr:hypothetical protein [Bacteroidia bacterium]